MAASEHGTRMSLRVTAEAPDHADECGEGGISAGIPALNAISTPVLGAEPGTGADGLH